MNRDTFVQSGATPFNELWTLLKTNKDEFVKKMQSEQKIHDQKLRVNNTGIGSPEYRMMQEVWTEFHKKGGQPANLHGDTTSPHVSMPDDSELPLEPELPKMQMATLMNSGATSPFDRLWGRLAIDKQEYIAKMRVELKKHREWKALHPETPTGGNNEYMMMHWVWHYFHEAGQPRVPPKGLRDMLFPPPPPPGPHAGQFTLPPLFYHTHNPGYVPPALTPTQTTPQTVQWVQGNRILMRPENREVRPGEPVVGVRILR